METVKCHCFHLQVTAETQEKEQLITHLQEKVASLEKKLEQNLSGEEHVQELLKEVTSSPRATWHWKGSVNT